MESFIIQVDPGFFQGVDATDHTCQMCRIRPAVHVHHVEFKKMGGRGVKMTGYIERTENKREVCLTCHDAIHIRRFVSADGFCCDVCPKLRSCYYGSRLLALPYRHLPQLGA